jgi:hypothetical protein
MATSWPSVLSAERKASPVGLDHSLPDRDLTQSGTRSGSAEKNLFAARQFN